MNHPVFLDIFAMTPEVVLALGTMLLMVIGAFGRGSAFKPVSVLALVLWASCIGYLTMDHVSGSLRIFEDMVVLDGFSRLVKIMVAGGAIASLMLAMGDVEGGIMARFEYPVLMSFSVLGMFLMVSANDLLSLYVGLELSSLSLYVLAAFNRNCNRSSEAGLKYFVLGAISSGLLLFGSSLIYGFAGSTQFDVIQVTLSASSVPGPNSLVVLFGMVLVISAMAFKISAVPFHMWTPDVYEGAPSSVTAFFAIVPKLAAIALLVRLVTGPFAPLMADMNPILTLIAVASMVVGAFAAIVQTSLKRLIAYSSIGNVGYAMLGIIAGTHIGVSSLLMYMAIYMVMTAGTFGIILSLRRDGQAVEKIADLAGLSKSHPVQAYGLAALMFSMSGIPPLAGFFGKYAVFQAAVAAHAYTVAVIGVLTSVVAAWYYINIIRVMFFEDAANSLEKRWTMPAAFVVTASLVFIVGFVVHPDWLAVLSAEATANLIK